MFDFPVEDSVLVHFGWAEQMSLHSWEHGFRLKRCTLDEGVGRRAGTAGVGWQEQHALHLVASLTRRTTIQT
jgi:hypothetical protein